MSANRLPLWPLVLALLLLLALSLPLASGFGPAPVAFSAAGKVLLHQLGLPVQPDWEAGQDLIVWQLRLPRVLLGGLVGAGLALVGAALQAATRNQLADPHLLGVSSGATLGAVTVMLFSGNLLGALTLPLAAFAGALLATLLVVAIAMRQRRLQAERLLLSGVAVSFLLMALANLLLYLGDQRSAAGVLFWMLGGLGQARWELLPAPLAALVLGLASLLAASRPLNALMAGEQTAVTLGVNVGRLRLLVFAVSSLLTGAMVAVSGAIGFVGLMIPHIARRCVGADHRRLLPVCALLGALFLIWVDAAARTLIAPEDIPAGVGTAAVGGVFFIWLLRRR
ncbi:iron ABC transporter permease [Chromobacterium sp. IIBBL 290-4]|uniref:FecCD family ABC transporter permease n=1 Tax=Chromobacterium sp. IIBBL 290-4 TaxID=2953890 RepID=UPI0020B69898|nr:iron ABC transporter permease [Chromobacterium sp. IIBBL 290-4]UTH74463.1 iron ABC transporter permease [Chromobacterium sp. IIBBL 290-4]